MTLADTAHRGRVRPLRIAMVLPPWYEIPPKGYGGIELVCATLVNALAHRGHDVTVFGAGDRTVPSARFVSTTGEPQFARLGEEMPAVLHAARVDSLLPDGRFDVIHDHSLIGPLTATQRPAPTVVTVHGPADSELGDYYHALGDSIYPVAISHSQRSRRPELPWAATVHNAIDAAEFVAEPDRDGPVLWLGRFSPDKGPDLAITACREAGIPLVLAGKCNEAAEARYLDRVIRPMLGEDVRLVLNADRTTTRRLLTGSRCLLMPIRWHEPFGMVMIEALASGMPVVALRRGAVPEVIRHGVTGWICDDVTELPAALRRVDGLDSGACVAHVRAAFGADLMAHRYEQVYRDAVAGGSRLPARTAGPLRRHAVRAVGAGDGALSALPVVR